MMYKALRNLRLSGTEDVITNGVYFCDDVPYVPEAEIQKIPTGEKLPGSSQVPQPILYRPGFWSNTPQSTKNLLIGYAVDIVDEHHADYDHLVQFGVIQVKPTRSTRKQKTGVTEEENES